MNTILVWFLVSSSYYGGIQYSPPMSSVEDCRRAQAFVKAVHNTNSPAKTQCIQLRIPSEGK